MAFLLHFFFAPISQNDLPAVPWNARDGLKTILFASFFLFLIVYGGFAVGSGIFGLIVASGFVVKNLPLIFAAGIGIQISLQIFFLFWYSRKKYNASWSDLGFRSVSKKILFFLPLSLFCIGALFQEGYIISVQYFGFFPLSKKESISYLLENGVFWKPLLIVLAGVIAPILEELLFRGLLLGALFQKINAFWAVALSAFIFAAAHLQLALLPLYFFLGIILGLAFVRTKSILPGIIFHSINNSVALWFLFS